MQRGKLSQKLSPGQKNYLQAACNKAWLDKHRLFAPVTLKMVEKHLNELLVDNALDELVQLAAWPPVRADSKKSIKDFSKSIRALIREHGTEMVVLELLHG